MTGTVLRGRVLTFVDEPKGPDDVSSYRYWEDGAVFISDGKVISVGDYHKANIAGATVIDHHPHLILPGLIDAHVHYPQMQVIGAYAGSLLEWLNTYTFVEEQKFIDFSHAQTHRGTVFRRAYSAWHDDGGDLLHGAQGVGGSVFRRGGRTQYADARRQGDDGPQRSGGPHRHAAAGL